jgi:hypothetical protein
MASSIVTPEFLSMHGPPHRAIERRVVVTDRPGLRLRFYPGVRHDMRHALKGFARWLRQVIAFRHPVRVTVVPHATVMGLEGAPGWAVFLIPPADYQAGDVIRIFLAGGKVTILETHYGLHPEIARTRLIHDLAHEVVHYEQWRDKRTISERGVNRRAAALTRLYLTACADQPISASRSAAAVGNEEVRTSWPESVTTTSSSIRIPVPRNSRGARSSSSGI